MQQPLLHEEPGGATALQHPAQSGERRRVSEFACSMPFLLIRPDEFGACQDMPLHCRFELRLG